MEANLKPDDPRGRGGAAAALAIIIVGLILAYPLSLGPVACVVEKTGLGNNGDSKLLHALELFYAPLIYVIETGSPVLQPYMSYLELFIEMAPPVAASAPRPYVPPAGPAAVPTPVPAAIPASTSSP